LCGFVTEGEKGMTKKEFQDKMKVLNRKISEIEKQGKQLREKWEELK